VSICIVVAEKHDIHADAVVDKLRGRCEIIRIDPTDTLPSVFFHSESSQISFDNSSFGLAEVSGVYCRFALESQNFDHISSPIGKFSAREHYEAMVGIFLNIQAYKWINYPWKEAIAEGKIYPLAMARSIGLSVPPFTVSSSTLHLLDFNRAMSPCIVKPISDMQIAKQNNQYIEVPDLGNFSAPYTADFSPLLLQVCQTDDATPTLIQKKIEKKGEVRIVIIDDKIFATHLVLSKESNVDSRIVKNRQEAIFSVGNETALKLQNLIKNILGLRFATMDMVQDEDESLHLVDINPSGNWLWQEIYLKLPISSAISDALLNTVNSNHSIKKDN
jgi:hypothetical protein